MLDLLKAVCGGCGIVGIIAFFVILLVVAPFLAIWSVNTLFHTAIPFTFWTWLAAMILTSTLRASSSK